ncbi:hypothetical protein KBD61_00365 [Patescibacteria group bacterium]|nr:hypothetical protein [Patescibacteria group bacterium]MBP9709462.1 hypothetical protein [Patescibacteria group bacterium]
MPLAKPARRKVANTSVAERSFSAQTHVTAKPRYHRVTKVPLAVSVAAFLAVIAVIVGSMAANSMQRDDEMLRADLERVQQDLSDRVARLEQGMMPAKTPAPLPTPVMDGSTPVTVTVTAKQLNEMRASVDMANWNTSATTETVEYRDTVHAVLVRLPYSAKWGNAMYKIAPYEVEGNTIWFGPVKIEKAGDQMVYSRMYKMEIGDKVSYDDAFKKYVTDNPRSTPNQPVKQRDLSTGGLLARIYTIPGMDTMGTAEYIVFSGKKFNYTLSTAWNNQALTPAEIATFSAVIRSLRAI